MSVKSGLQRLLETEISRYRGSSLGLVCNATSVNESLQHSVKLLHEHPDAQLGAIFGPQHGIFGETQDNMVEWESYRDTQTGLPVYSLYSQTRIPSPDMMEELDVMIFDMQDVGARYYTFIYTMAHVMTACKRDGKKAVVLDRPNPLGGEQLEGNLLKNRYASFVGMYPILIRHGMTVGELALMFNREFGIECDLDVIPMDGWERRMWFDETGLPWVIPSPNMPTLDTAIVYPGMCLLEGTNLSEGRGTTRPFELFGAPFIDPNHLAAALNNLELPGAVFRAVRFRPTFQKWKGIVCGGNQLHVVDRNRFRPALTAISIIRKIRHMYPEHFRWRLPPYEYEYEKLPFDILSGSSKLRRMIDSDAEIGEITETWAGDEATFRNLRAKYILYS
ncbi:DUF1343 domain-containing protein [bacterium]|nr:DUF1343 domain-containing protein [candidate division CSSED10-310 bacterium]